MHLVSPALRDPVSLSYVLVTRNKLEFLKEAIPRLLATRQPDEEVIVIDGGSTDGTPDYLRQTFTSGGIDLLISEADRGEGHALNKGILLARGRLIKNISDDDVYDWELVRQSRAFMETRPDIAALSGMAADWNVSAKERIAVHNYIRDFNKDAGTSRFFFNCLPLMIRKDTLPLLGLFSTEMTSIDLEFSLRITAVAPVAYINRPCVVRVYNQKSVGLKRHQTVLKEIERLYEFYATPSPFKQPTRMARWIGTLSNPTRLKKAIERRAAWRRLAQDQEGTSWSTAQIFELGEAWLNHQKQAAQRTRVFIHRPGQAPEDTELSS